MTLPNKNAQLSESQNLYVVSRRHSIPWVSLDLFQVPAQILAMVPRELARNLNVLPIYIRTSTRGEKTLYVAMRDPGDKTSLQHIAATAGLPVRAMLAHPSEIAKAIAAYYYGQPWNFDQFPNYLHAFRTDNRGPKPVQSPPPFAAKSKSSPPPVPPQARKSAPPKESTDTVESDTEALVQSGTEQSAARAPIVNMISRGQSAMRRKRRRPGGKINRNRSLMETHRRNSRPPAEPVVAAS